MINTITVHERRVGVPRKSSGDDSNKYLRIVYLVFVRSLECLRHTRNRFFRSKSKLDSGSRISLGAAPKPTLGSSHSKESVHMYLRIGMA